MLSMAPYTLSTVSSTAATLASPTQPLAHQSLTAKSVLQESSHLLVLALVLIAPKVSSPLLSIPFL